MIFINKSPAPPSKLLEYQQIRGALLTQYGLIINIPEVERKKFENGYRNDEVRNILFNCSYGKCAYCELKPEGSSLRVEHYLPKTLYPEGLLDWSNLLPSCEKCNSSKFTHDTKSNPIINPCETDPSPYFIFELFRIRPSPTAPDHDVATRTIHVCRLNRMELVRARSRILVRLTEYINDIEEKIMDLQQNPSNLVIKRRVLAIEESFENIEKMAGEDQHHSALIQYHLNLNLDIEHKRNFLEHCKQTHYELFQDL